MKLRGEKKMNKINIRPSVKRIAKRHNLNEDVQIVLECCYDDIYQRHGRRIPTIEYNDDVTYNEMGIMFAEDIDDKYLSLLSSLFDNYEYRPYDYLYYRNICETDIEKILSKYPTLSLMVVREITMYSSNHETAEKIYEILSQKDETFQKKVCSFLLPVSVSTFTSTLDYYGIGDFKRKLKNTDYEFSKDYLDLITEKLQRLNVEKIKQINLYFIWQFEYLFQTLYIANAELINGENIDTLQEIRKYILDNSPKVTGNIKRIPQYKTRSYEVMDEGANRENAWYPTHTEYETVHVGDEVVSTINYQQKEILSEKKDLLELLPMILKGEYDYQRLFHCNCSEFISKIIESIKRKDIKVKKKCE